MRNFENDRNVTLEELAESGVYPIEIIEQLKFGRFNCLNELENIYRNQKRFMEPLLFAVKNSKGTYGVYKYYGEELQKDITLVSEIVVQEPELIENTAVSDNDWIMLQLAQVNPKSILYMSDELKNNGKFIQELCELGSKEATSYAVQECNNILEVIQENPSLVLNPGFMLEAVKEDAALMLIAAGEIKNSYEFIKEASKENYEVVDQIINNKDEFGLEAIKGAKDTTRQLTIEDSIKTITEETKTSEDKRYQKVLDKVKEKGEDNIYAVRWVTAMVAQSDKVSPEFFKKVFDDSILTMIEIQKDLTPDGKEKVSKDNIQRMVTPHILNKLKERAAEQGLVVDAELESKLEEYTEFFNSYRERLQEEKRHNLEQNKENRDEIKTYKVNYQASREHGGNVTIIEPIPSTNLEEFAKDIIKLKNAGNHIITKFNEFEIDSNNFSTPEDIVAAYKEEYKTKRNNFKPEDIERVSGDATLSDIQIEPTAIRKEITTERGIEIPEKNEEEIGE